MVLFQRRNMQPNQPWRFHSNKPRNYKNRIQTFRSYKLSKQQRSNTKKKWKKIVEKTREIHHSNSTSNSKQKYFEKQKCCSLSRSLSSLRKTLSDILFLFEMTMSEIGFLEEVRKRVFLGVGKRGKNRLCWRSNCCWEAEGGGKVEAGRWLLWLSKV